MPNETPKPTKKKKLTLKQRAFVQELIKPGASQTSAYQAAYGVADAQVAASAGNRLAKSEHVQEHIVDVLANKYPDAANDAMEVLRGYIRDPELRPSDKLKSLELLSKFLGWAAPNKSMHLHAKVDAKKYKLPGEE